MKLRKHTLSLLLGMTAVMAPMVLLGRQREIIQREIQSQEAADEAIQRAIEKRKRKAKKLNALQIAEPSNNASK